MRISACHPQAKLRRNNYRQHGDGRDEQIYANLRQSKELHIHALTSTAVLINRRSS